MTTDTYQLRTLIAKWRGTHGSGFTSQGEFQAHISTLRTCADELEAALAPAPPSPPAGVEWPPGVLSRERTLDVLREHNAWRRGARGPQTDARLLGLALDAVIAALSQQPAAPSVEAVAWLRMKPDGTPDWAEDCIGSDDRFLDHELASDGYYLQPLYTAPQQPAAGEEIMVNAAHDVYTLPLQPSGLLSGPRFVVHVPGPEQPAAVDGLAARLVDELDGLVGESYGVSGLHLNGDVATWDELLPGGRFERLSSLDELRAALAAQQQEVPRG